MKERIVYVHGKGGSAEEAEHYKPLFPDSEVIGFDYRARTPWEAAEEFSTFFAQQRQGCGSLTLIANSIGAFLRCPHWMRRWWTGRISSPRWWTWSGSSAT